GGLWIGSTSRGIAYWRSGRVRVFEQKDGLPGDSIRSILVDPDGTVWAGTTTGLGEYRDGRWRVAEGDLPDHNVRVLIRRRDGSLWVGTSVGLARQKDGAWTSVGLPGSKPAVPITALHEDREGRLWVGTNDDG